MSEQLRAGRGLARHLSRRPPISAGLAAVVSVLVTLLWGEAGPAWAGVGAVVLLVCCAYPLGGSHRSLYQWAQVYRSHRRRRWDIAAPLTAVNDRQPAGVRYQDGVAVTAVRLLGKYLCPTRLTGAATSETDNVLRTEDVAEVLHQQLGLRLASLSLIIHGSRMRADGDFAPICDTFIGPCPYAGQREAWLILRIDTAIDNVEALRVRRSLSETAVAAAQRTANMLRTKGIRAEVASETDLVSLDEKLGSAASLDAAKRRWLAVRDERGWLSSFYFPARHIEDAAMALVWERRHDAVTQNITLYPDGRCTATVTVRGPQIVSPPPNVKLFSLPGEQAAAVAANRALPGELVGAPASVADGPPRLALPIGNSGVLIGTLPDGQRLVLPFTDPATHLRINIDADAAVYKRLLLRAAASGERVTVHTADRHRWQAMAMPGVIITEEAKPAAGTTISVIDTTIMPSPAPATVITLTGGCTDAHMRITQEGTSRRLQVVVVDPDLHGDPALIAPPRSWRVDIEFFAVENPYLDAQPAFTGVTARPSDLSWNPLETSKQK